nr:hypothetical protein [Nitrospirota bacterium]
QRDVLQRRPVRVQERGVLEADQRLAVLMVAVMGVDMRRVRVRHGITRRRS